MFCFIEVSEENSALEGRQSERGEYRTLREFFKANPKLFGLSRHAEFKFLSMNFSNFLHLCENESEKGKSSCELLERVLGTPGEFWNAPSALPSLQEAKCPIRQTGAGRLPRDTCQGRMKDMGSVPLSLLPGRDRSLPWTCHFASLCLSFLICKMEITSPA